MSSKEQLNRIEQKLDKVLELLEKKSKKNKTQDNNENINNDIIEIYEYYKKYIHKKARLLDKAKQKIKSRLKIYTKSELKKAIKNFSKDDWWMMHNAHRGVAWFFHSDERIEQFLNLKPQKISKLELFHNNQPCKIFDNRLKIYAPWSGLWLEWNKNHPQYEKFILKQNNKIIAKGQKAYKMFIKKNNL